MKNQPFLLFCYIVVSVFIAMVLFLIPPPTWAIWFKPPWVELIIFFWILYYPDKFNLISAWFIGLIIDVLNNSPLGEHALVLIIATYFVRRFYQQLQMFPLWQQSAAISFIVLFHQALLFWIQNLLGQPASWVMWCPPALSLLFWPLIVTSFNHVLKNSRSAMRYH